jgi:sterol desaturase/sphingolipid hydroxylase (fatty acid hydroxylase superfamily)
VNRSRLSHVPSGMSSPASAVGSRPVAAGGGRRIRVAPIAVVGVAGWLSWRGTVALAAAGPWHVVRSAQLRLAGPIVLGFVLLVFAAERRWPAQERRYDARGHRVDALYLVIHALVGVPIMVLAGSGFSALLAQYAPWLVLPRLAAVPRALFVLLAVVAIDGFDWVAHYGSHRLDAFWRLHRVHHSQEELSILTSFRTHPLLHLGFVVTAIPVLVLAANNATPAMLLTAFACFGALPHANLRWTFGRLGKHLVSPAYHRVHHRPDGELAINLGTLFTYWDRLAGRAVWPDPTAPVPATGLSGRPMPVEFSGERPRYLRTVAAQLLDPFISSRADRSEAQPPRATERRSDRRSRRAPNSKISIVTNTGSRSRIRIIA